MEQSTKQTRFSEANVWFLEFESSRYRGSGGWSEQLLLGDVRWKGGKKGTKTTSKDHPNIIQISSKDYPKIILTSPKDHPNIIQIVTYPLIVGHWFHHPFLRAQSQTCQAQEFGFYKPYLWSEENPAKKYGVNLKLPLKHEGCSLPRLKEMGESFIMSMKIFSYKWEE